MTKKILRDVNRGNSQGATDKKNLFTYCWNRDHITEIISEFPADKQTQSTFMKTGKGKSLFLVFVWFLCKFKPEWGIPPQLLIQNKDLLINLILLVRMPLKSYPSIMDIPNFTLKEVSATSITVFLFQQCLAVFKMPYRVFHMVHAEVV